MGLIFAYTLRNGGNDVILDIINRNNLPKKKINNYCIWKSMVEFK